MKNINLLLVLALVFGFSYPVAAQTDNQDEPELTAETTVEADVDTTEEDPEDATPEDTDVTPAEDTTDENSDESNDESDPALDGDDETETYNSEVEVTEEELIGEVVEITDTTITIETADGELRTISRGGGGLLSPFVRAANFGDLKVGDTVEVTIASEATLEGTVSGVSAEGVLTVKTADGQDRTIAPGASNVVIKRNGQVVTDFTTLTEGDEVEIVYTGEIVSDVDSEGEAKSGWVVPVVIILIVLVLAAVLAKRGNRKDFE